MKNKIKHNRVAFLNKNGFSDCDLEIEPSKQYT